ncbi:phage tail tape measure protein [Corynebacterium flavescens]|uniref:NlpC/P60 domain-containing protein n=1 Tax=Corynebacterium flavescens TaxID=28028 RepID=A0A1L7CNH6_CORFL|nr:phage tail tape measure protein [Corynebacterium flavescens]APT87379.1 hypothetical protein CFLV_09410 [Corynebacterium flavescens]KAA8720462.1 phage tail tape measure protein [Corynebacterium flavescens]GEB97779.1 hypothetical protein CFL01nite_12740 [Corynebacterium flavescens]
MAAIDLGDLGFAIKVDATEFDAAMEKVASKAKSVDKQLEATGKKRVSVKADTNDLSRVESSAKDAGKALDAVGGKRVSPSADSGNLDKVSSSAKSAASAVDAVGSADATPKASGAPLDKVSESAQKAKERVRETSESAAPLEGMFSSAAGAAAGLVGALAGIGSAAAGFEKILSTGMDFQSEMNTMSAVSGATAGQLAQVSQKARELGTDASLTATSATDATAAMTELAKGGFTVEQSMGAAKGTLQLAAAAQIGAADAATIQSQALQSFSLGAEDAARVSDVLAGAANASSAEIGGIAQGLQQSGTVASQFGLSIDDTATALAMFANAGIQGSDAGTLLKTALLSVTDQGKPAQAAIEELGLTVYDAQGKFVGMESLLGQLKTASESMTDEQYQAATATLFGSDAMRMAGIAAQTGSEGFTTLRDAVTRQGQAAEVAAAQTQGLPGVWERLQNTMEDVYLGMFDNMSESLEGAGNAAVDMIDAAAPALESFAGTAASALSLSVDTAGKAVDAWNSLPAPLQEAAKAIMGVKLASMALGTDLGQKILEPFKNAKTSFSTFNKDVGTLRAKYAEAGTEVSRFGAAVEVAQSSNNRYVSGMATSYAAASAPLKQTASAYREMADAAAIASIETSGSISNIGTMSTVMGRTVQASVTSMAGTMKGVGAAAFTGLKTSAKDLLDFLGGPMGLGLAAAGYAVSEMISSHQKAQAAQESYSSATKEAADAQERLNAALAGSTKELGTAEMEDAAKVAQGLVSSYTSMGEQASGLFSSLDGVEKFLGEDNASWWDKNQASLQLEKSFGTLKDTTKDLGIDMNDLGGVIAKGGTEYDGLMSSLRGAGDSGNYAAYQLDKARTSFLESVDAARDLDPAAAQAAAGIDVLADSSASADDKLSALKSTMQAMGLMSQTADEANMEAAKAIDELASSVGDLATADDPLGEGLFDGEKLDYTNQNAQALSSTLGDMSEQLMNVANSGGDTQGIWELMGPQLSSLRDEMGLTGEEFDDQWSKILESYGLVPEVVTTLVELDGASEAVESLGNVWAALYPLEEGATINIDPPDPAVLGVMDELGVKYEEIKNSAGETIQYKVTAPSDEIMGQFDDITTKMAEIDDSSITIETIMDDTPLQLGVESAKSLLDELDIEEPSPTAQLLIDQLLANGDIARGDLEYLNQQSANPSADLEKSLLDAGVSDAHSQLQGVNDHSTRSIMDGDSSRVRTEASNARNSIDSVPTSRTTTFIAKMQGAWNSVKTFFGGSASGTSRFADGGVLPAYADGAQAGGYRLPTTGLGTGMVDGFLGVNGNGMPIARVDQGEWVVNGDSSDQYNRTLAAINANNPQAILASLARELPAYADGGRARSEEVIGQLSGFNGGPYVMGGFSPSAFDCSGAIAATVNTWLGLDTFDSRMSTVNEGQWLAAKGFEAGRGNGNQLVVGWYDYGGGANGHTAMMLPDGTFIESGGSTGQGFTIGGAAGPLDGRGFTNFMYLPGSDDGSGEGGGIGNEGGDLGETDGYGTDLDIDAFGGVSGVGGGKKASFSKASAPTATSGIFHAPGLASNAPSVTVGQSLGGNRGQVEALANQYGYGAQAASAMNFMNPFVGQNSFRDELGSASSNQILSIAKQLEQQLGQQGITAQVEAALDAKTPNWDVWLRVNDDTIDAFNRLGEAKADRKNAAQDIAEAEEKLAKLRSKNTKSEDDAAEKLAEAYKDLDKAKNKEVKKDGDGERRQEAIEKAEKKISELKEKASENEVTAAEQIKDAEEEVTEARDAEAAAIMEVKNAQLQYNTALQMAPIKAAASFVEAISDGFGRMAENLQLMADNMDHANAVVDAQQQAELDDMSAKQKAFDAARELRELERDNSDARHSEVLAQQQAEYDLALARHDYQTQYAGAEIDLANLRTKGILDVSQKASDTDRLAILSASAVQIAEKQLELTRAQAASGEFSRQIALEQATYELNYQQEISKIQQERLAVATNEMAQAAALAAGQLGGSTSAMAQAMQGKQKTAGGLAGALGGLAQIAGAVAMTVATGGAALPAAIALGVGGIGSVVAGVTKVVEGKAQEDAYKDQAKEEYNQLSDDDKKRVDAANAGMWLGVIAGAGVGMAGGSQDDVSGMFDAVTGAFNLPLYKKQMEQKYGAEAAALLTEKAKAELDRREKAAELEKAKKEFELGVGSSEQADKLAEMQQTLQQQLDEMQQENKQLAGIDSKLGGDKSVLMSIGGSGWGVNSADGMSLGSNSGGFGGLTRDEVGEWSSLNVEDGWLTTGLMRPIIDALNDSDSEGGSSGWIDGLPETVVDGLYARQLAESGAVPGAVDSAGQSLLASQKQKSDSDYQAATRRILDSIGGGDSTTIGTQFTGPVNVTTQVEDDVMDGLRRMAANA